MSDNNEKTQSHSWWQALPGVLTAVGAFITAVTGLLLALNRLGIIGVQSQAAPTAVTSNSTISQPAQATLNPPATELNLPAASTAPASNRAAQQPVVLDAGGETTAGDGVPIAPKEVPNLVVAAQAAQEAEFLFLLPVNPGTAELQVGQVGRETARIPVSLEPAQPWVSRVGTIPATGG